MELKKISAYTVNWGREKNSAKRLGEEGKNAKCFVGSLACLSVPGSRNSKTICLRGRKGNKGAVSLKMNGLVLAKKKE